MGEAKDKPSCGMALVGVIGIPTFLLFVAVVILRPQEVKQKEPDWISSPRDGNVGTICAAEWFRMALLDMRTDPEAAQSKSDTAQAFLDLGKGDREKAITLSRLLDRPISNQGCLWEYNRDELHAAEAAARARRNADIAAKVAP